MGHLQLTADLGCRLAIYGKAMLVGAVLATAGGCKTSSRLSTSSKRAAYTKTKSIMLARGSLDQAGSDLRDRSIALEAGWSPDEAG